MYRIMLLLAFCLPMTMAATPALAVHKCGKRCVKCPRCHSCCEFKAEEAKEEKSCYKIECEEICVPRIVWPWQNRHLRSGKVRGCGSGCAGGCAGVGCSGGGCTADGCTAGSCGADGCAAGNCGSCFRCKPVCHRGARVIKVRTFKKHTYECPTCEYSWSLKKNGGNGCGGNCGGCSACAPQESSAEEAPAEESEAEVDATTEGEPVEAIPLAPVGLHEFPVEEPYRPASPSPVDRKPTADAALEPDYSGVINQPSRTSATNRVSGQRLTNPIQRTSGSQTVTSTGFFDAIDFGSK